MKIAIIGSTGTVGKELITLLEERNFSCSQISFYASENSLGKQIQFKKTQYPIQTLKSFSFHLYDIVFLCAGATISQQLLSNRKDLNCTVIDLSSAFRMDSNVPLIIPEINGHLLQTRPKIIASPNCIASILVMVLYPLSRIGKLQRVVLSTYQAASGGGKSLLTSLLTQTKDFFVHPKKKSFHAFNLYLHPSKLNEDLYSEEEEKIIKETQKILGITNLPISVTAIRVPSLRSHCISLNIEFTTEISLEKAKSALKNFPGLRVIDKTPFITAQDCSKKNFVYISRIRKDISHKYGLEMWVCADQIRKGASLNALQIAEKLQDLSFIE